MSVLWPIHTWTNLRTPPPLFQPDMSISTNIKKICPNFFQHRELLPDLILKKYSTYLKCVCMYCIISGRLIAILSRLPISAVVLIALSTRFISREIRKHAHSWNINMNLKTRHEQNADGYLRANPWPRGIITNLVSASFSLSNQPLNQVFFKFQHVESLGY